MIGFTRIAVIVPDSTPEPSTAEGYQALFELYQANIVALSNLAPYAHRWLAYPSPQNLYRASEWLASHGSLTTYQIFAYFAGVTAIIYSILVLTKFVMRTSVPWHVSPLLLASLLLHIVGDVRFGMIKERLDQNISWLDLLTAPELLSPFHELQEYSGPAAYVLVVLGCWEIINFTVFQVMITVFSPKARNYSDWLVFLLTILLAFALIEPEIVLPLISVRSNGTLVREKRVSMDDFKETVVVCSTFFMACTFVFAVVTHITFSIAVKLVPLVNSSLIWIENTIQAAIPKFVDAYNAYYTAPVPTYQVTEPVQVQPPSIPYIVATSTSHSASITATTIESFFWRQLCIVRGQLQELQADLSISTVDLCSKYNRAVVTLTPIQSVLTKIVDTMTAGGTSMDRFEVHLDHIQRSLGKVMEQMALLNGGSNGLGFFKAESDQDFFCSLDDEEKTFWRNLRMEQYDIETSLEGENDLNRLAKRLDEYTFLFFPQLHRTTDSLKDLLKESLDRQLDASCTALDAKEEVTIKREDVEIKKEDVLRRFQSITEYEFNTVEAIAIPEEVTPTATPPAEDAGTKDTRSVPKAAAAISFNPRVPLGHFYDSQPFLVTDALNANFSDSETIDLEHDTAITNLDNSETANIFDDTGAYPSRSITEEVAASTDVAPIEQSVISVEEIAVTISTANISPTDIGQTETSWVIEEIAETNTASSESAGSQIESPDVSNTSGDDTTLRAAIEDTSVATAASSNNTTSLPPADEHTKASDTGVTRSQKDLQVGAKAEAVEIMNDDNDSSDKSDSATCPTAEVVAPAIILDTSLVRLDVPSTPEEIVDTPKASDAQKPARSNRGITNNAPDPREGSEVDSQDAASCKSEPACEDETRAGAPATSSVVDAIGVAKEESSTGTKSPKPTTAPVRVAGENAASGSSSGTTRATKGTPDDKVTPLWTGIANFEFRHEDVLRDPKKAKEETMKSETVLSFARLGEYLYCDVRGNRAEMQSASKIVNCLATYAKDAMGKKNTFNIGTHSNNYFRACIWLGQAYLTRFTVESTSHVFIEVPIEGLIKLAGFGVGAFKNANMLPLPNETWRQYLERLPTGTGESEEGTEKTILNKAATMHGLLQRYLGASPQILDREVPRAEGWNESSSIDSTHCLKLVMENLLLLPPFNSTVESAIIAWQPKRERTKKEAAEREAEQAKRKEALEKGLVDEKVGKKRPKKKKATSNNPTEVESRHDATTQETLSTL